MEMKTVAPERGPSGPLTVPASLGPCAGGRDSAPATSQLHMTILRWRKEGISSPSAGRLDCPSTKGDARDLELVIRFGSTLARRAPSPLR